MSRPRMPAAARAAILVLAVAVVTLTGLTTPALGHPQQPPEPTPPFPTLPPTEPFPTLPPGIPSPAPFTPSPTPGTGRTPTPTPTSTPSRTPPKSSPSATLTGSPGWRIYLPNLLQAGGMGPDGWQAGQGMASDRFGGGRTRRNGGRSAGGARVDGAAGR